jgi:hypothetical protein
MKRVETVGVFAIALALVPTIAGAGGTPHTVTGPVFYYDGTVPTGSGEVGFSAWILGRPGESLSEWSPGCASYYDAPSGQWLVMVECGSFPTPWSHGEVLHVLSWGDGSSHGGVPGAGCMWVVLDSASTQQSWYTLELHPPHNWNLWTELQGGELVIHGDGPLGAEGCGVYRDTTAHFYPDVIDGTNAVAGVEPEEFQYSDPFGVGDPNVNAYYRFQANYMPFSPPGCPSGAVGEFDYSTATRTVKRLHIVKGTAIYSDGTVPVVAGEVTFGAYITTRPEELLTEMVPGCASFYSPPDWWVIIQCATFPTPWSVGETLHIDFWLDGTSHGGVPELYQLDMVLDDQPVQDWGTWWWP